MLIYSCFYNVLFVHIWRIKITALYIRIHFGFSVSRFIFGMATFREPCNLFYQRNNLILSSGPFSLYYVACWRGKRERGRRKIERKEIEVKEIVCFQYPSNENGLKFELKIFHPNPYFIFIKIHWIPWKWMHFYSIKWIEMSMLLKALK